MPDQRPVTRISGRAEVDHAAARAARCRSRRRDARSSVMRSIAERIGERRRQRTLRCAAGEGEAADRVGRVELGGDPAGERQLQVRCGLEHRRADRSGRGLEDDAPSAVRPRARAAERQLERRADAACRGVARDRRLHRMCSPAIAIAVATFTSIAPASRDVERHRVGVGGEAAGAIEQGQLPSLTLMLVRKRAAGSGTAVVGAIREQLREHRLAARVGGAAAEPEVEVAVGLAHQRVSCGAASSISRGAISPWKSAGTLSSIASDARADQRRALRVAARDVRTCSRRRTSGRSRPARSRRPRL